MRILFHHRIASSDGQSVHMDELIAAFREAGHELLIVGPERVVNTGFGADAGWVGRLKKLLPQWLYELLEFAYTAKAYRRLAREAARFRPDVIYERYNLFAPAGVWYARRHGLPLLLEVNAPLFEERLTNDGLALRGLARWTENVCWTKADHVLPVTEVLAGMVEEVGVPRRQITVIPNGIDRRRFLPASDPNLAKSRLGLAGKTVLGFVGFVRDWHRLERVIDWLAQAEPDDPRHLLLIGDGDVLPKLLHYAEEKGVRQRITATGIVSRDDLGEHLAAIDIALQPGVSAYASPLKLFEYMVMGKAILAPDTANLREVLTHGEDALLVPPEDDQAFALALEQLVEDAELRTRLGEGAARRIIDGGYLWQKNADRVLDLAEQAITERQSARDQPVAGRV